MGKGHKLAAIAGWLTIASSLIGFTVFRYDLKSHYLFFIGLLLLSLVLFILSVRTERSLYGQIGLLVTIIIALLFLFSLISMGG